MCDTSFSFTEVVWLALNAQSCWLTFTAQARRQGGFEGVRSNPPFGLQKILYAPPNCTFQVPDRLKVIH